MILRVCGVMTERSLFNISCFTDNNWAGCIENSRRPMPSSNHVSFVSPAISPQTDTGTPALFPVAIAFEII